MDIDDLLAAVNTRLNSSREHRSLRELVETSVKRRLGAASVVIRPQAGPPGPATGDAQAPGSLRIMIPCRRGTRALELFIQPGEDRPFNTAEQRFLERVAAVYALALEAESPGCDAARDDGSVRDGAAPLVGRSVAMQALRERIGRVASTDFTVLIEGESGSGKELVARQVHELSRRRRGPFVAVNCAALVETLLEAELFGIEDRTATGVRGRRGKFELAAGGTLFLDEVADLSLSAQAKLLRALQDFAVERVGGNHPRRVDIRIIVATNKRLRSLVEQGAFRDDLYYRLSGVELIVPPLRTRREDIAELARYFLERHRAVRRLELSPAAADALSSYDWPGNVRELERVVESALTLTAGDRLELEDLPPGFRGRYLDVLQPSLQERESLREWGRRYVRLVFQRCGENKREACRVLDISYHTLQAHLRYPSGPARRKAGPASAGLTAMTPAPALVREQADFAASGDRAGP